MSSSSATSTRPSTRRHAAATKREIAWLKRMYAKGSIVAAGLLGHADARPRRACSTDGSAPDTGATGTCSASTTPRSVSARNPSSSSRARHARLITAGGHSSWHDLALHLIARLCGNNHALRTAKVYLFSGHAGRPAAVCRHVPAHPEDRCRHRPVPGMDRAQLRVRQSGGGDGRAIGLELRERSRGASARPPGTGPWTTSTPCASKRPSSSSSSRRIGIDEISLKVGYDDPAFFRRLFKRKAGLTPAAYRRKFIRILSVGK